MMRRTLGAALALMALLASFAAAAAEKTRGLAIAEERLALVIGNTAYRGNGVLENAVNDARLIARALGQAGFRVDLRENLDRRALVEALRAFGSRLGENTVAVLYYAGHGLQLRDHNFMVPIDAEIRTEDEIPIAGVDLDFVLGRMSAARSRINIVILDACRNNPFAGRSRSPVQGLAQMDAPVGTLLAYATGPGKLAADGAGGNGLYAMHLSRHLLTPGLPVEHVFKRVREGVVRDTELAQIPWESSSLMGEFAFVPGVSRPDPGGPADAENALWARIEASQRADDFRAYLRQYPGGRHAGDAQARLAALSATVAGDALPRVGDTWRYRVQDQFRLGDLYLTARVDEVSAQGVAESWSTTSDAKLRTTLVPIEPGFSNLPGWSLTPPEFSPYLLAAGGAERALAHPEGWRRIERQGLLLRPKVEGEEEIAVAAGRFRTIKLVLRGQSGGRGSGRGGATNTEHVIWYAPQVRRPVKYTVQSHVAGALAESTTFELVEFQLH